ncbi:MAG: hypothetical protein AAF871_13155 [Pseudomonadota bacterium]
MPILNNTVDHLRSTVPGLRQAHAYEIVAAYFGYKSNVARQSDSAFPIDNIGDAAIMIPDVAGIKGRLARLNNLPTDMPTAMQIAQSLTDHIVDEGWFAGNVWLYDTIESYFAEVYVYDREYQMLEDLSGLMAETNAQFDEVYIEEVAIDLSDTALSIVATGEFNGTSDPDRMFAGDKLDISVTATLDRVAGRTCFHEDDFHVGGAHNDYWYDPDPESASA